LDASHLSCPEITKLVSPSDKTPLWVAIDGVTDHQSLGNLIQSCHFFGVDGIIIPKKYTAPVNALVSKFSNGAAEISPIYSTVNLPDILKDNTIQGLSTSGNKKEEKELDDYLLEHQPPEESTWRIIGLELPGFKKTSPSNSDSPSTPPSSFATPSPITAEATPDTEVRRTNVPINANPTTTKPNLSLKEKWEQLTRPLLDLNGIKLEKPTLLILGGENAGLRDILKRYCHYMVTIEPQQTKKNSSLNVVGVLTSALFHLNKGKSYDVPTE